MGLFLQISLCADRFRELTTNSLRKMSEGHDVLSLKEEDVMKMIAANVHLGSNNCDFQMLQYVYKQRTDGPFVINLRKTWEKLLLAARAIVAIENPADICVISSRVTGQRAILKFASATGATPIAGRFTPGAFTNQIQAAFREPRLLIVTDPRADHQPITESSYVNIPLIALCNTDSPTRYVAIAIPCNNKSKHSVGLMWWFLAREVLRLRGTIPQTQDWEVMCDLYFYRDQEEIEKDEQIAAEKEQAKDLEPIEAAPQAPDWGNQEELTSGDWAAEGVVPTTDALPVVDGAVAAPAAAVAAQVDDWSAAPAPPQTDAAAGGEWKATTGDDWGGATNAGW